MPGVGLEPTRLTAQHLKCCAATNYAIRAFFHHMRPEGELNPRIAVLQTAALTTSPSGLIFHSRAYAFQFQILNAVLREFSFFLTIDVQVASFLNQSRKMLLTLFHKEL